MRARCSTRQPRTTCIIVALKEGVEEKARVVVGMNVLVRSEVGVLVGKARVGRAGVGSRRRRVKN